MELRIGLWLFDDRQFILKLTINLYLSYDIILCKLIFSYSDKLLFFIFK